ncbi:MAG: molybdopterin molybdotransferase MoeA [Gammaproteobacteria bacterium]|nr:molybdopterin molybdotransferase MoeA [Gammaproteobacteria bacterium]
MIAFEAAQAIIAAQVAALPTERVSVSEALLRVAAEDVVSPAVVPPFANSAMDGFALRAADTREASEAAQVTLPVVGHTAAGPVAAEQAPAQACAWEIMTGAPVPAGFDAIVPVEQVRVDTRDGQRTITLTRAVPRGEFIREAGEDFRPGDPIVAAGRRINAEQLMAICATGVVDVLVRRAPRVAVIATGAELVSNARQALAPGQIRDSNNPYLQAMLTSLGAQLVHARTLGDDPAAFQAALDEVRALSPDVIITSGAVSAGVHDFIPAALRDAGASVHFHKVQIRPGKPVLFATLDEGTVCFGLPGNPLSVAVGLRFFVVDALRRLQGMDAEHWPLARLESAWRKPAQMRFFGKGQVSVNANGQLRATMLPGQESFRIAPLTRANAWIVLPAGSGEVSAGSLVAVAPLLPDCLAI